MGKRDTESTALQRAKAEAVRIVLADSKLTAHNSRPGLANHSGCNPRKPYKSWVNCGASRCSS